MLNSKKKVLRPLFESNEGIHLTIYLRNDLDFADLKSQLQNAIEQASRDLTPVLNHDQQTEFFAPLRALLLDGGTMRHMKGNVGLFRNEKSFRVLSIPIELEPACHLASSFHIKPLLKWLQCDQEFLFVGIDESSASLYQGSQTSFKPIGTLQLGPRNELWTGAFEGLRDWINQLTKNSITRIFLAGPPEATEAFSSQFKRRSIHQDTIADSFHPEDLPRLCELIRRTLKKESQELLEDTLFEFRLAEDEGRARRNIFHIAKAVVRGRVKKLIVTDELCIFGKIDKNSGGLAIHPFDLDHEDDDLLDDLAQLVLGQGGEVVIASRNEMPKGRPILAILDDDPWALEPTRSLGPS